MRASAAAYTVALAVLAGAAPAAAAPPGLWFWGSGDAKSLADIVTFQKATGAAAPTVYYALGGFSCAGGKFSGTMNATHNKQLAAMGIKVQATLGTSSIKDLRTIFTTGSTQFIADAVKGIAASGAAGVNLDWEPYAKGMTKWTPGDGDGVLNADGFLYAEFLDKFGKALHVAKLELSLDFFSNLAVWNLPAMNASAVDTYIDMDTYVQDNLTEAAYVAMASAYLEPARLGVGICPQAAKPPLQSFGPDSCGTAAYTPAMIAERLGYFDGLLADKRTAFRMMNMCCSGMLTADWWSGLTAAYKRWAAAGI